MLQEALDELAGADPELERFLAAGLITNGLFAPGLHRDAAQRLERVRVEPRAGTAGEKLLLSVLAYHDARAGRPAAEVVPLARKALADGTILRADLPAVPYPVGAGLVPTSTVLAMADLDEVLTVYEDALAEAHRHGLPLAFGAVKVFRAFALRWRGDLGEVEAEAREALAAAEVWGATARFAQHAAAFLADSLMEQGRLDEAAAVLAGAWPGEAPPGSTRLLFLGDSARRLRLLRGDLAGGLEEMLEAGRLFEEVGSRNPAFIAWRSPAALALLQLGRRDEAGPLAEEEVELARTWGAPRALGAALSAAGLVEGGERGLDLLEEAVEVLRESPAKLEHAKARMELGAALRRGNRRADAREQLRHALELATICGATALAARAERELIATGARPRRIALSGVESLTPSERRVAELAAEGPTNREIAQALFVTQRTVEVHLDEHLPQARDQLALAARGRARRTGSRLDPLPSAARPSLAVGRPKHCGSNLGAPTMRAQPRSSTIGSMFVHPSVHLENRRWEVLTAANHFGHRESDGIVVDLYWNRGDLEDVFRVEVVDERERARFVLYPTTGREAIQAFHHPFSAARAALNG